MKSLIYVTVPAACVVCLVLLTTRHFGPVTLPPTPPDPERVQNEKTVRAWLESQQKGQDGIKYWATDWFIRPIRLFAVSNYEIVDVPLSCTFMVRIHSATRGGQSVIRLYEVFVSEGKLHSVTSQDESERQHEEMERRKSKSKAW